MCIRDSLELDNDQKLYITEDTIVKYFLSKDKEISEEELKLSLIHI